MGKMSNKQTMIKENVIYQINGADLVEFAKELISSTKKELEQDIITQKEERYLSPQQVSEMLSVDTVSLWRWHKRGYLTHSKVGGKNRYKLSDVKRIMEGK